MEIQWLLGHEARFMGIDKDLRTRFRTAWYQAGRLIVRLYSNLMFNQSLEFRAPLNPGPKILAANHPSTIDPFLMTILVNEPVSMLILDTLFKIPVVGHSLRVTGHIRVDPQNGRKAMDEARQALKAGCSLGIFPEGIISPTNGAMHTAHTGMARLALSTGAPVFPVGIALDSSRLKKVVSRVDGKMEEAIWYLSGPYAMTVGAPLTFHGNPEDRLLVQAVSEQIMHQIAYLSSESARRLQLQRWHNPFSIAPMEATLIN